MADKKISELSNVSSMDGNDLFVVSQPDGNNDYNSKNATVSQVADKLNNSLQYTSDLQTTSKTIIGAINELKAGGGGGGSSTLAGLSDTNISSPTDGQALIYDSTNQVWKNGTGGGGNADYVELTQAQYDALTDAQKTNGKMYFITDVNGDGSQFQPVIYSETEREIGVWTNGKPLYQRTFKGTVTGSPFTFFNGVDYDIDEYVSAFVKLTTANSGYDYEYISTGYVNSGNFIGIMNGGSTNKTLALYYDTGSYSSGSTYCLTIQYTKTTDTAGSGTWTPQGVPSQHYSTTEQVVGTWIDGRTLYEKTIETNTTFSNNWTKLTEITGVDCIVDATVVVYEGGNRSYGIRQGYFCEISTITGEEGFVMLYNNTGYPITVKYVTIRYTKSSS